MKGYVPMTYDLADYQFYQQVRPVLDRKNINDAGETGGLWHANYLLSRRFPKRLRPYLPHVPKVVTRTLHHEAVLMFKDELYTSTQRRFRESKAGRGDIQLQWLSISLRVRPSHICITFAGRLNDRSNDGGRPYCGHSSLRSSEPCPNHNFLDIALGSDYGIYLV